MSLWLVALIAALTYASRAVALVAMPHPSPALKRVLDRVPAPLFAALAAISLFDEGRVADPQTLMAAAGAIVLAPTRSLLWVLVGGVVGYAIAALLF